MKCAWHIAATQELQLPCICLSRATSQESPPCAFSPHGESLHGDVLQPDIHRRRSHDIYGGRVGQGLCSGLGCPWKMGDASRWESSAAPFLAVVP